MAVRKFLRQDIMRYSKIGKNRKKLQKWRRPKGRHSKMRKMRKGYPVGPSVGYKVSRKERGKINGYHVTLIMGPKELSLVKKGNAILISGKIGARKKMEIIKKAQEIGIKVLNMRGKK